MSVLVEVRRPSKAAASLRFALREVLSVFEGDPIPSASIPGINRWERDYTLFLACGHSEVRRKARYPGRGLPDLPGRVRCKLCPPETAKSIPTEALQRRPDPLVRAILAALHGIGVEEERLAAWQRYSATPFLDETSRVDAYGRVGLWLIEQFEETALQPDAGDVRERMAAFIEKPSLEARDALRKVARRLYGRQHAGGDWFANRGIIAAATSASTSLAARS